MISLNNSKAALIVAASVTLAIGVSALPANAASSSGTKWVSCDAATTTTIVTLSHTSGALKFTQTDTVANLNNYNWATSSNGNNLSKKATTDGHTVSWTGVQASNYTFKVRPVTSKDCNWPWWGEGDTQETYTAKTNQ